jgi:DNA invertase Pin-like site-specific DNA recombinase
MGKSSPSPVSPTPLRCAIYLRVSDPGATDKFGMDAQRAECLAYAERQGWVVVAVFEDWQTGTELFARTEMTRCREAMRRGEFDVLLVDRLDRLSRKARHQGYVCTEAEQWGVAVASATEDLSDPLMVGVHGAVAEANRDAIVKNMARGKRRKAANGLPLGQGKPPFGLAWRTQLQTMANGAVVVRKVGYDEDPASIGHLRRIFADYDRGLSLRALGVALEADGLLPPYHDRTGSLAWRPTTLRTILTNRVYVGNAEAFRTVSTREPNGSGGRTRRRRPTDGDARVVLPAATAPVVVDPALFARVQRRLDTNKREACRRDRNPEVGILRRGYAVCGGCGHPLTVVPGREQPYYRCHTDGKRLWGCPATGAIPVVELDEAIWSWLTAELADEARVRWHLEQMRHDDADAPDLAVVERTLAQITKQQTNVAQAVAQMGDNPDGVAPLLAQLDLLGKQRKAAEAERGEIAARQAQRAALAAQVRDLQEHCRAIAATMAEVTDYPDRRAMLAVLGVRVTLYPAAHRPRWTAASIVTPEGITSENLYSPSACTAGTSWTRSASGRICG